MAIKSIHSDAEFTSLVTSTAPTKLVVVDFWATWCGPCHAIAPTFNALAQKYKHCIFAKVDVDELQDVASRCGVSAMPTFHFYKAGQKVAELKGANPAGLEAMVKQHQGPVDQEIKGLNIGNHSDLAEYIDRRQIECLNQKTSNPVGNIWTKDGSTLESDADEQLIIVVPFNQTVKLHSIRITPGPDISTAPKLVKTFVNRLTLGFDDADAVPETESLTLTENDFEPNTVVPLRFVRYQNVNSVVLFVESNQGDQESTVIRRIQFFGSPVETTKMSELKKHDHGEAGASK